jgi:hypothetical protein
VTGNEDYRDATLLTLKSGEGTLNQRMRAAFRRQEGEEVDLTLEPREADGRITNRTVRK